MVLNPSASHGPLFPGQAPGNRVYELGEANGTIPSRPPSPSPCVCAVVGYDEGARLRPTVKANAKGD